jgi:hypothetical protein
MENVVYADAVLAVTGLMLFAAYGLTALVFGIRVKLIRLILGSFAVSLISTVAMLFFTDLVNPVSILVLVMLGTYLCLGVARLKDSLIYSLTSLAFAALVAGAKSAVANMGLIGNTAAGVIATAVMVYTAFLICLKRIRAATVKKQRLYRITVCKGDLSVRLTALADTGNELRGPNSESVIIADRQAVSCLFATAEAELRLLPYKSIGKDDGVLVGVLCDYALVNAVKTERVIVAAVDGLDNGIYNALFNVNYIG